MTCPFRVGPLRWYLEAVFGRSVLALLPVIFLKITVASRGHRNSEVPLAMSAAYTLGSALFCVVATAFGSVLSDSPFGSFLGGLQLFAGTEGSNNIPGLLWLWKILSPNIGAAGFVHVSMSWHLVGVLWGSVGLFLCLGALLAWWRRW